MSASQTHDLIVALITRRFVDLGYKIAAIESSFDWLFGAGFQLPPAIVRHRPDVLGVRPKPPLIAIGDAKTPSDLSTRRTAEQLHDYASARTTCEDDDRCYVVIGVPKSCARRLKHIIGRIHPPARNVEILEIPDNLLPEPLP